MAIDNFYPSPPTDPLADEESKTFYPLPIPISHWQLRHFISVPASASSRDINDDIVYYASGPDVYCLDRESRKRKLVTSLPFDARCTASGYGWVCVGGDDEGRFAALKFDGSTAFAESDDRADTLPRNIGDWRTIGRGGATDARVERIGEDIVNSISVHRLTCPTSHLEDTVAVLTNNDKTVRVYSLLLGRETCCKDLPFAMNHATISPCGTLLVAVGDEPKAFFFQREMLQDPPQIPKPHNRLNSSSVGWQMIYAVDLHVSPGSSAPAGFAGSQPKGYFTTAWSPNSKLCAVGSEGGYITVFDADLLPEMLSETSSYDTAVVAVVPGSRPDNPSPHPGAIRSMLFSPHPWDLLFWTEDQGRICIGDLRTGLRIRQVVELEIKEPIRRGAYVDIDEPTHAADSNRDPALEGNEDEIGEVWLSQATDQSERDLDADVSRLETMAPGSANFARQYLETLEERRRLTNRRRQGWQHQQPDPPATMTRQGLTHREQQLLDSIRVSRQREEIRAAAAGSAPLGVNYTSGELFSRIGESSTSEESTARLLRRTRNVVNLLQSRNAIARTSQPLTSDEQSGTETAEDDEEGEEDEDDDAWRPIERLHAQQRRADRDSTVSATRTATTASPETYTESANPSTRNNHTSVTYASTNPSTSRTPGHQLRVHSSMYPPRPTYAAYETMFASRHLIARNRNGQEVGARTTGLALSQDARTLFAACEEGIFEINVNLKGRMFWKAMEIR
jgi:WD40 repeat protein